VTKPALYQYFPGKEDLYEAVAEHNRRELKGILEHSYQNQDIHGGSAALFDAVSRFALQFHGVYAEMMLLAPRNERIRLLLEEDRREDIRVI
jgi:AcrR family transcriptional regulator